MGTTVRRQPVNFDIPKSPDYKFLNITNFRGLDVSSNPFELASNTASDCLNVYVDETNTLTTRPRLEKRKFEDSSGRLILPLDGVCIGVYPVQGGYLFHYDTQMCLLKNDKLSKISAENIPQKECKIFEQDSDIYLVGDGRYMVIQNGILSDVAGYVPNTSIVNSSGVETSDETLNLLTDLYTNQYPWEEPYLPEFVKAEDVVETPPLWKDKTELLTELGYDTDTVLCAVYPDGSFCARKDRTISYYWSDDSFETINKTDVFKGESWREYVYAFAKDSKVFSVLNTVGMSQYQTNYAEGFRFVNDKWESLYMSVSLYGGDTFVDWSFSRDGRNMVWVKKTDNGTKQLASYCMFTASWSGDNPDDIHASMSASAQFEIDETITVSYVVAFNKENKIGGLIGISNGGVLQLNLTTNKADRVASNFGDFNVFDYTANGSKIILAWGGFWGALITDFNWDDAAIVSNEWVKAPTKTLPQYGIEDIQPQADVVSSNEPFVAYALAWSPKGNSYRDIHYLGDATDPAFDAHSIGVLGLDLPSSEFAELFVDFRHIVLCKGSSVHFYVRQYTDKNILTVTKRLTDKHAKYSQWLARRKQLFNTSVITRFNNQYWFAAGNTYCRSKGNNPAYFPLTESNLLGDSNEDITGFNLASDATLIAYKSHRLYLIQPYDSTLNTVEYLITESKNTVGNTALKAPIVTTLTEIPLQINNDGIYGLSQMTNVSATERIADLLSEPINERWLKIPENIIQNVMTLNRLYWTYVILPYDNETAIYLLDNRTNSWYYWVLPITTLTAFVKDDVVEFVDKSGIIYYLTTQDIVDKNYDNQVVTKYYDYGEKLIRWYWQSQVLPLGTINYAKRLVNTTFILTDTDENDGYGLRYSFRVFRKLASSVPEKEITDKLTLVRSTTRKTNVSKFGFIQLRLDNLTEESRDYEAYENNKLRLVGLGLKYVLLEGLIR